MEHQKIFPTNIFIEDNFIDISKGPEYTDGCIHNMKKTYWKRLGKKR